jgi:hypothetical protein
MKEMNPRLRISDISFQIAFFNAKGECVPPLRNDYSYRLEADAIATAQKLFEVRKKVDEATRPVSAVIIRVEKSESICNDRVLP